MKVKKFDVLNICKIIFYVLAFVNLLIAIYVAADAGQFIRFFYKNNNLFFFLAFLTVGEIIDCIIYTAENKIGNKPPLIENDRCYTLTINFSIKDVKEIKERVRQKGYDSVEEYTYNLVKNDVESFARINIIDDYPPRL